MQILGNFFSGKTWCLRPISVVVPLMVCHWRRGTLGAQLWPQQIGSAQGQLPVGRDVCQAPHHRFTIPGHAIKMVPGMTLNCWMKNENEKGPRHGVKLHRLPVAKSKASGEFRTTLVSGCDAKLPADPCLVPGDDAKLSTDSVSAPLNANFGKFLQIKFGENLVFAAHFCCCATDGVSPMLATQAAIEFKWSSA
jgi:hypothetical protein